MSPHKDRSPQYDPEFYVLPEERKELAERVNRAGETVPDDYFVVCLKPDFQAVHQGTNKKKAAAVYYKGIPYSPFPTEWEKVIKSLPSQERSLIIGAIARLGRETTVAEIRYLSVTALCGHYRRIDSFTAHFVKKIFDKKEETNPTTL